MRNISEDLEIFNRSTQGKWEVIKELDGHNRKTRINCGKAVCRTDQHCGRPHHIQDELANAEFIAMAHDGLPWYINKVQQLIKEIEELRTIQ